MLTEPDYALPPNVQNIEILRVVVRESMSADLLDMLIADILSTTETLMASDQADLDAFARPQAPRIEKYVASMGTHSWKEKSMDTLKRYWSNNPNHEHKPETHEEKEKGKGKKRGGGTFNTTC